MEFQDYTTRLEYGKHPAGTACKAKRESDKIILLFDDGTEVHLPGDKYWLPEIEPRQSYDFDLFTIISQKCKEELCALEDARVFKELDSAINRE